MTDDPYVPVKEVMSQTVQTVDSMATVRETLPLFKENRVSSMVIKRRHDDDEFGMISIPDIAEKVIAKNKSPDRVQVYEIMTKPILTLPAEMHIKYAIRQLVEFGKSRAVVINHEREIVGIVTLRDMVLRYEQEDL